MNSRSQSLQLPLSLNGTTGDDALHFFVLRKYAHHAENSDVKPSGSPSLPLMQNGQEKNEHLILVQGINLDLFNDFIHFIAETHKLEVTHQQVEGGDDSMVNLGARIKDSENWNVERHKVTVPLEEHILLEKEIPYKAAKTKSPDESNQFLQPDNEMLQAINKEIEKHLEDDHFKACNLAKAFNICEMQLHRKLKKFARLSPANYIRKYRLHRSRSFLKEPSSYITQVCFKTGFRSLEYFSRSFKKEFGISPSVYRHFYLETI